MGGVCTIFLVQLLGHHLLQTFKIGGIKMMEEKNCGNCDWHGYAGADITCHSPKSDHRDHETSNTFSCQCWENTRELSVELNAVYEKYHPTHSFEIAGNKIRHGKFVTELFLFGNDLVEHHYNGDELEAVTVNGKVVHNYNKHDLEQSKEVNDWFVSV